MVARVKLVLKVAAAVLGLLVYVWFAAVRSLPLVKLRKRLRGRGPRRLRGAAPVGGGASAPTSTLRRSR